MSASPPTNGRRTSPASASFLRKGFSAPSSIRCVSFAADQREAHVAFHEKACLCQRRTPKIFDPLCQLRRRPTGGARRLQAPHFLGKGFRPLPRSVASASPPTNGRRTSPSMRRPASVNDVHQKSSIRYVSFAADQREAHVACKRLIS